MENQTFIAKVYEAWDKWWLKRKQQPSLEMLYKATPKEQILLLEKNSRENGMMFVFIYLTLNILTQLGWDSDLEKLGLHKLIAYRWAVSVLLIILILIYYKLKVHKPWLYETILMIITIRNIEP